MSINFEDYLDAEVFEERGSLIGIFECFWTDDDDQAQFLGIKLDCSPDRTCVVPVVLGTADERQSCLIIRAPEKHIANAPSLGCDEELKQDLEEQAYMHFDLTVPSKHHELHIKRLDSV